MTPLTGTGTVGEDTLRQQSLMLELTPVLMCDGEQRITYWNRSAELLYGFTREEALCRTCHELLQTRFPEPLEGILARVRSGRQWQGELSQVRSDGRRITVASEWISYLGAGGELEAIIEVNHEITDRKLAEESLAKVTARFEGIIASAIDAIISIDAQQKIVLFNPAAARLFGVPAEEALGQSLSRFIPERFRGAHTHHVEKFGQTGVSTRRMGALGTVSGLRANGEEFPIEASISQVEVGGEKLFTVILRDITERQRAEQDLREAQAALEVHAETLEKTVAERTAQLRETVAELEAFSYSLSHDMRAPLRAIHTFTHIVLDDYAKTLGADATDLLKKSLGAAHRMDRLIQDVLAFSRVSRQPIELRPVDVERLVLATMLERPELQAPGIDIKVDSPEWRLVCA
jgi:PAS domain S-box-containing protein